MIDTLRRHAVLATLTFVVLGGGAVAYANGMPARSTLAAQATTEPPAQEQPAQGQPGLRPPNQRPSGQAQPGQAQPGQGGPGQGGPGQDGPRPPRKGGPGGPVMRRAIHGDLIVRNAQGGFDNVSFDKGTITEVKENQLKLDRPDGKQVVVKLTADTRYRGVDGPGSLQVGRRALVVSKGPDAIMVAQRGDKEPGQEPADSPTGTTKQGLEL